MHADWTRVGEEHFEPHYTARDMLAVIPWALAGLPPEGLARMREQHRGGVLLAAWRAFLRRPFERRERRAFRYV